MAVKIEISDTHVKALTEFYIQRLKVLREEMIEREKEIKEINATIQLLRKPTVAGDLSITKSSSVEYSEKWPWIKKIQFAIAHEDRPLTTREVVDVLTEFETAFIYDRKRAIASISSVLSNKWGPDKDFGRQQSESGDFAYYINEKEENNLIIAESNLEVSDELPF
jgi:hypothetical protein